MRPAGSRGRGGGLLASGRCTDLLHRLPFPARPAPPHPTPPPCCTPHRIVEFAEKPKGDALKRMQVDTTILGLDAASAREQPYIASMGIYVCKASTLQDLLSKQFRCGGGGAGRA